MTVKNCLLAHNVNRIIIEASINKRSMLGFILFYFFIPSVFHYCFLWGKCVLTSVSRSEEETMEEVGEPVSKVLKETDPDKSRFLTNPTLAFSGLNPKGHPSSCIPNQSSGFSHLLKISKKKSIKSIHYSTFTKCLCVQKRERERERAAEVPAEPWFCSPKVVKESGTDILGGHLRERMTCHSTIIA